MPRLLPARLASRALAFLILLGGPSAAVSGDYHLFIKASVPGKCTEPARRCDNTCGVDAVLQDIRQHAVEGHSFDICAVRLAFDLCTLTLPNEPAATRQFYTDLASLLATPALRDEKGLISFIGCFRRNRMREAIKAEMRKGSRSAAVEKRMQKALAATHAQ